jgi:hypothetical protein
MSFYESRVYFLDIKSNQIYRSNKGGSGFSTPSAWIKDSTDVRSAVSLTVDGSIFCLKKTGEAIKLTSGQRQSWSLAAIEPALSEADKIWTNTTINKLYILDIGGKRLIEFSKPDGKLLNQYTVPTLTQLKDFAIDPTAKKAYLLNGSQILAIDLLS